MTIWKNKKEEIEQLKLENTQLKYKLKDLEEIRVRLQLRLNDESRKEFSKSLQAKLQQAKEGLEFYESGKHYDTIKIDSEMGYYFEYSINDYGGKAREKLEIINKEG